MKELIRVYSHFLILTALEELFFIFPCLNIIFYIGVTGSQFLKFKSRHSGKTLEVSVCKKWLKLSEGLLHKYLSNILFTDY